MSLLSQYIQSDPELQILEDQAKDQGFANLEELFLKNQEKLNSEQKTMINEVLQ
jgi:hypothetical protein